MSKGNSIEKPYSVENLTNSNELNDFYCFRDEEENMTNTFPASTHHTSHENEKSHEKMKMRKKEEEEEQKGKTNKIIRCVLRGLHEN